MIRIGVAGLGWWGKQIVACLKESARFHVVAGYDLNPAPLADFTGKNKIALAENYETMLARDDIDAIVIVTPHTQHETQVLAALAAGKQVFCEKPLALSAAAAERILAACAQSGKILGIGHERRYEPAMEELQTAIAADALGKLMHIDANVSHNIFHTLDPSNWRLSKENAPAGAMTALGVHLTDLCIALVGKPARVAARTRRHVFAPPADDLVALDIDFAGGATARVTCLSATPYYGRFTAFGDKGWMEVTEAANVDQGLPSTLTGSNAQGLRYRQEFAATNTVLKNFEAWADAMEGRARYRFTPEQMLDNVRVLEAVVRSVDLDGAPILLG